MGWIDTDVAERVQGYLHVKARAGRESLIVGGFTLYLPMGNESGGVGLAVPNRSDSALNPSVLERIERIAAKRGHRLCFHWLDCYAPKLAEALGITGYAVRESTPLLVCEPGQVISPPTEPLEMVTVSADSPSEDVAENWNINAQGFDPTATLAGPGDAEDFRHILVKSRAFTARLNGVGVSAGMYTDIHNGVTELVGIATLQEYRRRGFGGALTAFATRTAFADGATLAFLTAASEEASRVYKRVGYQPAGNLLLWAKRI
ncbi:MAG: GNAT family N-acetyltransferase [Caldilineaceae bacterium]|nr:GNAT family N-acetyltransferase [Caldilineaceae bacterium]